MGRHRYEALSHQFATFLCSLLKVATSPRKQSYPQLHVEGDTIDYTWIYFWVMCIAWAASLTGESPPGKWCLWNLPLPYYQSCLGGCTSWCKICLVFTYAVFFSEWAVESDWFKQQFKKQSSEENYTIQIKLYFEIRKRQLFLSIPPETFGACQ